MEGRGTSRFTQPLIMSRNCEFLLAQLLQSPPGGRFRWPDSPWVIVVRSKKVIWLWSFVPNNSSTLDHASHFVPLDNRFGDSTCSWPRLLGSSGNAVAYPSRGNATGKSLERCDGWVGKIHLVDIEQVIVHFDAPLHISFGH